MRYLCEELEKRVFLSGNVIVDVADGVLRVRGDGSDNAIQIDGEGLHWTQMRVIGLNGTTVNGREEPLLISRVNRDVHVDLAGGNNSVLLNDLSIRKELKISSGGGNDTIAVVGTLVHGRLRVITSGGDDQIRLETVDVHGETKISTGSGDDDVAIVNSILRHRVHVTTDAGDDSVILEGTQLRRKFRLIMASGDDVFHATDSTVVGQAKISMGWGNDDAGFYGSVFSGKTIVRTGNGNDTLHLSQSVLPRREIDLGRGVNAVNRDYSARELSLEFDFRQGAQGWAAGFADHPASYDPALYELESGLAELPPELDMSGTGFHISGRNRSSDLYMFLKRRLSALDGIVPGQAYEVHFKVTFASNSPDATGFGVFLKVGATPVEPQTVVENIGGQEEVRMNVDKGNQANDGPAGVVIGTVGNGLTFEDVHELPSLPYLLLEREQIEPMIVQATPAGVLWLLVGTDSGLMVRTSLFYTYIQVTLVPVN